MAGYREQRRHLLEAGWARSAVGRWYLDQWWKDMTLNSEHLQELDKQLGQEGGD